MMLTSNVAGMMLVVFNLGYAPTPKEMDMVSICLDTVPVICEVKEGSEIELAKSIEYNGHLFERSCVHVNKICYAINTFNGTEMPCDYTAKCTWKKKRAVERQTVKYWELQ